MQYPDSLVPCVGDRTSALCCCNYIPCIIIDCNCAVLKLCDILKMRSACRGCRQFFEQHPFLQYNPSSSDIYKDDPIKLTCMHLCREQTQRFICYSQQLYLLFWNDRLHDWVISTKKSVSCVILAWPDLTVVLADQHGHPIWFACMASMNLMLYKKGLSLTVAMHVQLQ